VEGRRPHSPDCLLNVYRRTRSHSSRLPPCPCHEELAERLGESEYANDVLRGEAAAAVAAKDAAVAAMAAASEAAAAAEARRVAAVRGRGLHSSTFRLNVGAFCATGGVFWGCLRGA
jgi:hypothetical protein